jgi:CheY-like chemotaxis protein
MSGEHSRDVVDRFRGAVARHLGLDVILADYWLLEYDAMRALERVREQGLDVPVIVVTGSISEEAAAECIEQGAADYLLKERSSSGSRRRWRRSGAWPAASRTTSTTC